ncbi:hypothetical protein NAP1_01400 [Erythrobacter sp. NAP1]|uniref:hypothetical protein n=1 Tax=Erythrobacter sp. NAP1 TaxID=237727 RepID=UPI0000686C7E|nr:hypothetical protein [Erythrobacter sp. NAP1]EAQ29386.1 hypothetical protein NAP1_01400 [Erythrobacter sp. NAP1]
MLTRFLALLLAAIVMVFASQPAAAKWHKAESDRFVIYSNSEESDLADFAEMLERYHVAMELESGRQVAVPSPSNRLTIFLVGSIDDLQDIYGAKGRSSVAGFYIPRANGSVAFAPNIRFRQPDSGRGRIGTRYQRSAGGIAPLNRSVRILLHEYAHHFLISSARHAMPRWLSEGAAEYFSSARFNDDGSIDIGLPNNSRAWEISQAAPVSVPELLDYELYRDNRGNRYDAYYGRSWLLFHYLRFNPERAGQLAQYWQYVAQGADSMEAAQAVFGDLDALESELRAYGRERSMAGMRFASNRIRIGSIKTSELSEGHAAMMQVIMRSKSGVNEEEAAALVEDARRVAERFPGDAHVLAALAEAEYDAGFDDAAIEAANRAIVADPGIPNAYVQQGYALFRKAKSADDSAEAFDRAMGPFQSLNAIEADHTQPLIYYYRSFAARGLPAPEDARFALERASQLAPFDKNLSMEVAVMLANEGKPRIAEIFLRPVAADPHGRTRAAAAQAMLDELANASDGSVVRIRVSEVDGSEEG